MIIRNRVLLGLVFLFLLFGIVFVNAEVSRGTLKIKGNFEGDLRGIDGITIWVVGDVTGKVTLPTSDSVVVVDGDVRRGEFFEHNLDRYELQNTIDSASIPEGHNAVGDIGESEIDVVTSSSEVSNTITWDFYTDGTVNTYFRINGEETDIRLFERVTSLGGYNIFIGKGAKEEYLGSSSDGSFELRNAQRKKFDLLSDDEKAFLLNMNVNYENGEFVIVERSDADVIIVMEEVSISGDTAGGFLVDPNGEELSAETRANLAAGVVAVDPHNLEVKVEDGVARIYRNDVKTLYYFKLNDVNTPVNLWQDDAGWAWWDAVIVYFHIERQEWVSTPDMIDNSDRVYPDFLSSGGLAGFAIGYDPVYKKLFMIRG